MTLEVWKAGKLGNVRKTLNGLESLEGSRCLHRLWIDFESLGKLGKVESLECLEWLEKSESFGCLKVGMKRHFFRGDEGVGRGVLLQGAEETAGLLFVTGACHCVHNHISSDIFFIIHFYRFQLALGP